MPYIRPLLIVIFGTVIWVKDINGFLPSYAIAIGCYIYGGARSYFLFKKSNNSQL